jgi:hypothetical protein
MDYEKLMLEIKNKYFPELKYVKVRVKPLWILNIRLLDLISFRPLMWIFGNTIYYNPKMIKNRRYDRKILSAIFAHELAHVIQYNRLKLNWFQKIIRMIREWIGYIFDKEYISKIEKEADRIAIKKGFGKLLIKHRNSGESRIKKIKSTWIRKKVKKIYDSRINKIYYSSKDLEKLVKKK